MSGYAISLSENSVGARVFVTEVTGVAGFRMYFDAEHALTWAHKAVAAQRSQTEVSVTYSSPVAGEPDYTVTLDAPVIVGVAVASDYVAAELDESTDDTDDLDPAYADYLASFDLDADSFADSILAGLTDADY